MAKTHVLVLNGSWNNNGNSAWLINKFLEGLKQEMEIEERIVNVPRMNPATCYGCLQCRNKDDFYCVQKDETFELEKDILSTEIVVFAFPIYYFNMPGPIKTLLDRFVPSYDWDNNGLKQKLTPMFKHKRFVCIVNCADVQESFCERGAYAIKETANLYHIAYNELYMVGCDGEGIVEKDIKKQEKAINFGKQVGVEHLQSIN
ncbi:hypothetical protein, conserved [Entamoeba dispar SAW760]|uniref:NADPH-dependent FMN reductase-like domain-containing protein n=1 Tax=Entamoeba dispar (strain ATCC PRA-260 / SAW760) TaxID=370354 RepID=B0EGF2_ENTDS|nr:uncharacterized protein EDI_078580 [Entamoeba dispar SAW760]EDR26386.1 hypothetical protein, conserved [Entamoeba dispar SAW760]|eukprot:EDR26386.1 hypothetical protein, conserved [Entamoeba dispar SAW760]